MVGRVLYETGKSSLHLELSRSSSKRGEVRQEVKPRDVNLAGSSAASSRSQATRN